MSDAALWPRTARAVVGRAAKQALEASGYYRRRLRRLAFPGAVTFCYHGLLDGRGESVPFGDLHVTRDVFDGHCRLIAETCDPLSLSDLQAVLAGERAMPPRPIVITFDDGYASVLELALPVLERYGLPAAVFVALIPLLGMYVVTALYMFGTLRFQNKVASWRSALIALVVVVALYAVFERAFQVSLPHGLLGEWIEG